MAVTLVSVKEGQIFDSRGYRTVEVDVTASDGHLSTAAVPIALTGIYEALELRDGGSDYLDKGVLKAVENVNKIIGPAVIGKDPTKQTETDNFMVQQLDGIVNEGGWCKQKLGANAIFAAYLALCEAGAHVKKIPLYKVLIKKKYGQDATNVGDEGGFAPNIQENKERLELLKTAIAKAGYTGKVFIEMDVAASEFYGSDKTYDLNFKEENNGSQKITGDAPEEVCNSFVSECPILSIEIGENVNNATLFPNDVGIGMVLYSEYAVVIPLMVADKLCPKALVDTGSSVNVLFKTAFMEMGFNELQLHPSQQSLVGFGGAIVKPLGSISLPVMVEQGNSRFEAPMEFIVVDTPSNYDIILGEPFLVKSRASVIPYKQLIELHTEDGVVLTVRSNLRASRD